MQTLSLDTFLMGHVFAFMLLLARIGSVLMLFPGIGEHYVPRRTRMIFACLICLLLLEPMYAYLPAMPAAPADIMKLIVYETLVGLFFGTLIRLTMSALEAAGMIIGLQTGLSNATMMNPAMAVQSPLPSAFLSAAGLVLIFISGMDHFLIRATVAMYDQFPPGGIPMLGDMAQTIIRVANQSFIIGIELSAPFLIMGLLLHSVVGVLQRLMPSVQLFMVMLPVEIWGGLLMFSLTVAGILTIWMNYLDHSVGTFFQQ